MFSSDKWAIDGQRNGGRDAWRDEKKEGRGRKKGGRDEGIVGQTKSERTSSPATGRKERTNMVINADEIQTRTFRVTMRRTSPSAVEVGSPIVTVSGGDLGIVARSFIRANVLTWQPVKHPPIVKSSRAGGSQYLVVSVVSSGE